MDRDENSLNRGRRPPHTAGSQRRRMSGVRSPTRDAIQARLRNRPGMRPSNTQGQPQHSDAPIPLDRRQVQPSAQEREVGGPGRLTAEVRGLIDNFAKLKANVPRTARGGPRAPQPPPPLAIPNEDQEDEPVDEELYIEPQFLRDGYNLTNLRHEFRQYLPDVGIHYNLYLQNRPGPLGNEQHLVVETQVDPRAQQTLDNFLNKGTYYRQNVEDGTEDNITFTSPPPLYRQETKR